MTEAERLQQCRAIFERASADRVDMREAKRRLLADHWAEQDRRLAERRTRMRAESPAVARRADPVPQQWWQQ